MAALLRRVAAGASKGHFSGGFQGAGKVKSAAASSSPSSEVLAKAFGGNTQLCPPVTALFGKRMYSAKGDLPVPSTKLLIELNGKLMPAMGSGPAKYYSMSVLADSEDEALGFMKNFVSLLRRNDDAALLAFCANSKVSLTEVKESIGVAAAELMKQAQEHNTDVKAEFNVIKAGVQSGHEGLKALLSANIEGTTVVKDKVISNLELTNAVKATVLRIEKDTKKFTVLKFLGYASVLSLIQILASWRIAERVVDKVKAVKPPSDDAVERLPSA